MFAQPQEIISFCLHIMTFHNAAAATAEKKQDRGSARSAMRALTLEEVYEEVDTEEGNTYRSIAFSEVITPMSS